MSEEIKEGMRLEYGCPVYRHRGYDIRWNDNSETWSCSSLNLEHEKLSKVKDMISALDKKARDLGEGIPVIKVSAYGTVEMKGARAVAIDVNREDVWVITMDHRYTQGAGWSKKAVESRRKEKLSELILDTPEDREAIQSFIDAEQEARARAAKLRAYLTELPRLTLPELRSIEAVQEEQAVTVRKRTR